MPDIFRLEYPDGAGVYMHSSRETHDLVLSRPWHQDDPEYCPRPEEDGMARSAWSDMIFGFQSLDAMRRWFDGTERLFLSAHGVLCSKYFARGPIIQGRRQCAFYRGCATLIWQKPLNHF